MGSPCVQAWLQNAVLSNRGIAGCLTLIPSDGLSRKDVLNNSEVLIPVLKFLGTRPSVNALVNEVEAFFRMTRPRGKDAIPSNFAV